MERKQALIRTVLILAGGALALWISIGVTLSQTAAGTIPDIVRSWWPDSVSAAVAQGQRTMNSGGSVSSDALQQETGKLRAAALREPVNSQAVATLAAIYDYRGDKKDARRLFRLSERLSRRNTFAQLWLIEDAVARNSIPEAIGHYDRAMRVSYDIRPVLLPILVEAASDAEIRRALEPVLAQQPRWWKDYVQLLGQKGMAPAALSDALRASRLSIAKPDERLLAENILRRMVTLHAERMAIIDANRLEGRAAGYRSLQEGDFERSAAILPFGWGLRDETSIRAYRDTVLNGTMGLRISTNAGASGQVAQQLIGLASGRYTLAGMAGNIPADPAARPTIELGCAGGGAIARFTLPVASDEGQRFKFDFAVPATTCEAQWLSIVTAPTVDTDSWLDDLAIGRRP